MAAPQDLEHQIEQYLMGTLSEADEQALLDRAQRDPDLSGQIEWQRQVLDQLRLERRRELKTRLAAVPVGVAVFEGTRLWQGIAAGTGALMIAGAAWYFWPDAQQDLATGRRPDYTEQVSSNEAIAPAVPSKDEAEQPVQPEILEKVVAAAPLSASPEESRATSGGTATRPTMAIAPARRAGTEGRETLSADLTPAPGTDVSGRTSIDAPQTRQIVAPTGQITSAEQLTGRPEVVIAEADELAYQYYAGKLYLYGSFGGELYELIELYGEQGQRRLFVYYLGQFYPVLNETREIAKLEALTDPATIAELNLLRRRRVD